MIEFVVGTWSPYTQLCVSLAASEYYAQRATIVLRRGGEGSTFKIDSSNLSRWFTDTGLVSGYPGFGVRGLQAYADEWLRLGPAAPKPFQRVGPPHLRFVPVADPLTDRGNVAALSFVPYGLQVLRYLSEVRRQVVLCRTCGRTETVGDVPVFVPPSISGKGHLPEVVTAAARRRGDKLVVYDIYLKSTDGSPELRQIVAETGAYQLELPASPVAGEVFPVQGLVPVGKTWQDVVLQAVLPEVPT